MKKLTLLAAAMMLCAGMAFAQSPVKKTTTPVKTENAQKATLSKDDNANANANATKKECGKCPNSGKCCKNDQKATVEKAPCKNNAEKNTNTCKKQDKNTPAKDNTKAAPTKK